MSEAPCFGSQWRYVAAGWLGRKSSRGFYVYS